MWCMDTMRGGACRSAMPDISTDRTLHMHHALCCQARLCCREAKAIQIMAW